MGAEPPREKASGQRCCCSVDRTSARDRLLAAPLAALRTQGTYSAGGLVVSQQQSEAAYAQFKRLLNYAAAGLQGAVA